MSCPEHVRGGHQTNQGDPVEGRDGLAGPASSQWGDEHRGVSGVPPHLERHTVCLLHAALRRTDQRRVSHGMTHNVMLTTPTAKH